MRRLLLSLLLTAPALGQGFVPPPGVKAQDEGSTLGQALVYNFTGTGVTCTWLAPVVTCDVPSASFPLLAPDGTAGAPSYSYANETGLGMYRTSGGLTGFTDGAALNVLNVGTNTLRMMSGTALGWASSGDATVAADTVLVRDAADTLAQRRSTNAQTFRAYGTFTDTSNYIRAALNTTSTTVALAAETAGTGADNIDVSLTPAGTGVVVANGGLTVPLQGDLCLQDSAGGDQYCLQSESTAPAGTTQLTLNIDPATCTGDGNGGALTIDGSNNVVCSADAGGAGSGLPDAEVRIRVSYGGF